MSSARFNRLVNDAWLNNDTNAAIDAFNEYHISHCINPRSINIFDAHTQTMRWIQIPCGSCYHCIESKVNEWCTRMYAHAEDFKNVYFVTLTYRGVTNPALPVNKLFINKLVQAVWHCDAYNETRHFTYSPCLLVKSHYQNFIKRLRKNTGIHDLTYVLSGEYGSKYGRPHFHLILFSNGVLTKQDIVRAWSVCLWKSDDNNWFYRRNQRYNGSAYDFPIGRVDFHDLVSNGTFNTTAKVRVDGTYMNAANCFAYVCKYVVKRDHVNFNRVKICYNNLYHKEQFVKLFDNEVPYKICLDWFLEHGYNVLDAKKSLNHINKYKLHYEKTIFEPSADIYADQLKKSFVRKINGFSFSEEVFPSVYYDFRDSFKPFCEFSRGTAIGSLYAKRNLQEFKEGVFTKPILQQSGYVIPSYFRRKARNSLYGLRVLRKGIKGNSANLLGLPYLLGHFENSAQTGCAPFTVPHHTSVGSSYESLLSKSYRSLVDIGTGERIAFDNNNDAQLFKYDRHTRKYIHTRSVPLADFIRSWCSDLRDEVARAADLATIAQTNLRDADAALLTLTDLGFDTGVLKESFVMRTAVERKNMRLLYDEVHKSAE